MLSLNEAFFKSYRNPGSSGELKFVPRLRMSSCKKKLYKNLETSLYVLTKYIYLIKIKPFSDLIQSNELKLIAARVSLLEMLEKSRGSHNLIEHVKQLQQLGVQT